MNISIRLVLLLLACFLPGCPYVHVVYIDNFSGGEITINEMTIGVGDKRDIGPILAKAENRYRSIKINSGWQVCEFDLTAIEALTSDYYQSDSRGVYYRFLLDSEMRLLVTELDTDSPQSKVYSPQPDGFPLTASECVGVMDQKGQQRLGNAAHFSG